MRDLYDQKLHVTIIFFIFSGSGKGIHRYQPEAFPYFTPIPTAAVSVIKSFIMSTLYDIWLVWLGGIWNALYETMIFELQEYQGELPRQQAVTQGSQY